MEVVRGAGAGLFNLFAALKIVGEPAPTELLKIVQDISSNKPLNLVFGDRARFPDRSHVNLIWVGSAFDRASSNAGSLS